MLLLALLLFLVTIQLWDAGVQFFIARYYGECDSSDGYVLNL